MPANLPADYEERVYAGVLGKIIGVYLGRPFEGWSNERIEERLGEIDYYVHDKLNQRLIVTDDDISGTFTFIRAMEDYDCDPDLSPKQIGQSWLNYLIENRTILWWGRIGQFHRAHRFHAPDLRHRRAGERLHRDERQGRRRTDRRADLHRRLGHGVAGRPRTGGPTSRVARPASPTTARPSTGPRCWRPWRPRPSSNRIPTSSSTPASRRSRMTACCTA